MARHIVLTSHPQRRPVGSAPNLQWGAVTAAERGPVIASLSNPAQRNAIGTQKLLMADLKTFDSARYEAELALDAGADLVTVLGCAGDATICAAVETAHARGKWVVADVVGVEDKPRRARALTALGADFLGIHADEDVSPRALPHPLLRALAGLPLAPLSIAGGITPQNVSELRPYAPSIIVLGSALTKAIQPEDVCKLARLNL